MAGYGTDAGFQAWLDSQGLTLPVGGPSLAILRERGSAYIDAVYGASFCGCPVAFDQERAWPRSGVLFCGSAVPTDLVPLVVVNASYRAAYLEAITPGGFGGGLYDPRGQIKKQKVNELEREFFAPAINPDQIQSAAVVDPLIAGMLAPFLCVDDGVDILGIWAVGP